MTTKTQASPVFAIAPERFSIQDLLDQGWATPDEWGAVFDVDLGAQTLTLRGESHSFSEPIFWLELTNEGEVEEEGANPEYQINCDYCEEDPHNPGYYNHGVMVAVDELFSAEDFPAWRKESATGKIDYLTFSPISHLEYDLCDLGLEHTEDGISADGGETTLPAVLTAEDFNNLVEDVLYWRDSDEDKKDCGDRVAAEVYEYLTSNGHEIAKG